MDAANEVGEVVNRNFIEDVPVLEQAKITTDKEEQEGQDVTDEVLIEELVKTVCENLKASDIENVIDEVVQNGTTYINKSGREVKRQNYSNK